MTTPSCFLSLTLKRGRRTPSSRARKKVLGLCFDMSETAPEPRDELPDADEVFAATLRNLVNTPHTPHKPKDEAAPRGGPKD